MTRKAVMFLWTMHLLCSCVQNGRFRPSPDEWERPRTSTPEDERLILNGRLLSPGTFAPTIRMPLLSGSEDNASYRYGQHIVMFWASWCGDCKEATPAVVELQREYQGLQWITISLDNEAEKARQYVIYNGIIGKHLFDGRGWKGAACVDYAVPLHGIPYFFLIDSIGRIELCTGKVRELKEFLDRHEKTCPNFTP